MDVKLIMFKENGDRKDFPVRAQRMVIGRKADSDLRVPLPDISREHAELLVGPKGVIIRDLSSTNGTYVNNKRIKQVRLNPGDYLVIGPVVFTVQIDGKPANVRPAKTRLARRKPELPGQEDLDLASISDEEETAVQGVLEEGAEDVDPISALEALASGDSSASGTVLDLDEEGQLQP